MTRSLDRASRFLKTIRRQHATTIRKLDNIQKHLDELGEESANAEDEVCLSEEEAAAPLPWWKELWGRQKYRRRDVA